MKYRSVNHLQDFTFHDSAWELAGYTENTLTAAVRCLNIHKGTEQNPSDHDMEIEIARVTFEGFRVHSFEPGRAWKQDENGGFSPVGPQIIYEDAEAHNRLVDALGQGITMYHLEVSENNIADIDACGQLPFWSARFSFDSVTIEWKNYRKKAWYELHRHYRRELCLSAPTGNRKLPVHIICHDEEVYIQRNMQKGPSVSVGLTWDGKEIWGHGTDYLWVDAFADLQNRLPQDVTIRCCLTCRHGNLCPVGSPPDEFFCTKDVSVTRKSDLFFYTEDDAERARRSRNSTDVCEDYEPQSDDHFTYNDFLYQLKS